MKVHIYWEWDKQSELLSAVKNVLEELWLVDFIQIAETNDEAFKAELWIKESPALIIEEENIGFIDMIFEGMVPEADELKSMFTSIIGWGEGWWGCEPGWCGSCTSC